MGKKARSVRAETAHSSKRKRLAIISVVAVAIIALAAVLSYRLYQTQEVNFSLKAAIVDQLSADPRFADPSFVDNVTNALEAHGFSVAYYNQSINVDFYRTLAKGNFGIIILRVHSALRNDSSAVDLFTSERYSAGKYDWELSHELVTVGEYLYAKGEYYFAVTPDFIANLEGIFPKSIVIAMGCWSLKPGVKEQLGDAFLKKGAKAYIGWTDEILPEDTDRETFKLLNTLLNQDAPLAYAVSQAKSYTYIASESNRLITSILHSYPAEAGDLKLSALIAEARASALVFGTSSVYVELERRVKVAFK